ncbi:MAG: ankyrin repeat domain-containing protein [Planctomycetota bacterium]|jgi:26S proteasome non-ATPase regulatory subunit 10
MVINRDVTIVLIVLIALPVVPGCEDKDSRDAVGAIHNTAKEGNLGRVKSLLSENPELLNAKDEDGHAGLYFALDEDCDKDIVELLLAKGADVNAKVNAGFTALDLATAQGHKDVADLLRKHGGTE